MDALTLRVNLDCLRKDSQAIINAKVGEANGRKVVFTLYEGRTAFFVPAEATVIFRAQKPDGTILYNNCVIDDGKVEYTITSQTVAVAGVYACELQIVSDGRIIYSPYVTLNVMDNLYADTEVESSNEFTELENALNKIPSLEVINSKYTKPDGGIPKTDLANDVQASLNKADTALQEHQSLAAYRTASEQDIIDSTKQDKLTAGQNITITENGTISSTGGGANAFFLNVFVITETQVITNKTYAEIKAAIDAGDIIYITDKNDVVYVPQVAKTSDKIEFLWLDSHENRTYRWSAVVNSENAWSVTLPELVNTDRMIADLSEKVDKVAGKGLSTNDYTYADKAKVDALVPVATSGSYNDLTDKPTIPSVPTATINANAAARHEHSNKTVLDLISETVKAAWDDASTWVTTNGANVLSHLSDSIKHITAAERTKWNGKQDQLIAGDNITIAADGKTISATGGGGGVSGDNIETVEAQQIDIPAKLSDFENDSGFVTNSAVQAALADKQDTISDLENIRSGAGKGATALQAVPSTYRTALAQDVIDNGLSDRISAIEGKEADWNGKYSKPTNGIPKTDLAQAVQTSLSKADSALQSVPSTYRTASAQDTIDSGKVDKVTGKGLSTNDYTNTAKAKVDAIPANPKYTDTVYDDTAVKGRVSALESKLNGSGAVTFAAVTTDSLTTEGEVEIYGTQPHIDFHNANSTDDYTSRIIENSAGAIDILAPNGLKLNGSNLKYNDTAVRNLLSAVEGKEDVPLTPTSSRIKNVSYTAKYIQLLGAVLVRIYCTINTDMNAGYDYDIMTIDGYLPNSTAALAVKCSKNAMAIAKKGDGGGAIQIHPLEAGINGYDVWITGFWFV